MEKNSSMLIFNGSDDQFIVVLDANSKSHKENLIDKLNNYFKKTLKDDISHTFNLENLEILLEKREFEFDILDSNNKKVESFECSSQPCMFNMFEF